MNIFQGPTVPLWNHIYIQIQIFIWMYTKLHTVININPLNMSDIRLFSVIIHTIHMCHIPGKLWLKKLLQ